MTYYKSTQLTQLTREQGIELIREYQTTGSIEARNQVVESYVLLAQKASRKFGRGHRESMDDLLHQGIVAIIKACDNFNTESGAHFSSYVYKCINGYMLNALTVKHNKTFSLNCKVFGDDSAATMLDSVESTVGTTDEIEQNEAYNGLHSALTELSDRDRKVIELYFGLGGVETQTMQQIADGLKLSKMGVQKIITRSMATLKGLVG